MGKDQELLQAVKTEDLMTVQKLLQRPKHGKAKLLGSAKKVNVNFQDTDGFSPLHHAALNGNVEVISLLLESQAIVDIRDQKGMRPLHYAAWQGKSEPMKLLLKSSSSVNGQSDEGQIPLHLAAQHGHYDVSEMLLQHQSNPCIVDNAGKTPLDLACEFGRVGVVQLLLSSNMCAALLEAKPGDSTDPNGTSPLHLAAKNGHIDIIRLLIQAGIDINRQTKAGTALHEAALCGKTDVVRLLLDSGINATVRNTYSQTALDIVYQFTATQASREIKQMLRGETKQLKNASAALQVRAVKDYCNNYDLTSLNIKAGDVITVLEQHPDGRWKGCIHDNRTGNDRVGYFPCSIVEVISKRPGTTGSWSSVTCTQQYQKIQLCGPVCGPVSPAVAMVNGDSYHEIHILPPPPPPPPHSHLPLFTSFGYSRSPNTSGEPHSGQGSRGSDSSPHGSPTPAGGHQGGSSEEIWVLRKPVAGGDRSSVGSSGSVASARSSGSGQSAGSSSILHAQAEGAKLLATVLSQSAKAKEHLLEQTKSLDQVPASTTKGPSSRSQSLSSCPLHEQPYGEAVSQRKGEAQSEGKSSEAVIQWLSEFQLQVYASNFISAGYDIPTISRMTPEDLTAIGVTKPGHRKKITSEINKLAVNEWLPDKKPANLGEWLAMIGLSQYHQVLVQNGYENIDFITEITWEDLQEIGITKLGHQKKLMLAVKKLAEIQKASNGRNTLRKKPPAAQEVMTIESPPHDSGECMSPKMSTFQDSELSGELQAALTRPADLQDGPDVRPNSILSAQQRARSLHESSVNKSKDSEEVSGPPRKEARTMHQSSQGGQRSVSLAQPKPRQSYPQGAGPPYTPPQTPTKTKPPNSQTVGTSQGKQKPGPQMLQQTEKTVSSRSHPQTPNQRSHPHQTAQPVETVEATPPGPVSVPLLCLPPEGDEISDEHGLPKKRAHSLNRCAVSDGEQERDDLNVPNSGGKYATVQHRVGRSNSMKGQADKNVNRSQSFALRQKKKGPPPPPPKRSSSAISSSSSNLTEVPKETSSGPLLEVPYQPQRRASDLGGTVDTGSAGSVKSIAAMLEMSSIGGGAKGLALQKSPFHYLQVGAAGGKQRDAIGLDGEVVNRRRTISGPVTDLVAAAKRAPQPGPEPVQDRQLNDTQPSSSGSSAENLPFAEDGNLTIKQRPRQGKDEAEEGADMQYASPQEQVALVDSTALLKREVQSTKQQPNGTKFHLIESNTVKRRPKSKDKEGEELQDGQMPVPYENGTGTIKRRPVSEVTVSEQPRPQEHPENSPRRDSADLDGNVTETTPRKTVKPPVSPKPVLAQHMKKQGPPAAITKKVPLPGPTGAPGSPGTTQCGPFTCPVFTQLCEYPKETCSVLTMSESPLSQSLFPSLSLSLFSQCTVEGKKVPPPVSPKPTPPPTAPKPSKNVLQSLNTTPNPTPTPSPAKPTVTRMPSTASSQLNNSVKPTTPPAQSPHTPQTAHTPQTPQTPPTPQTPQTPQTPGPTTPIPTPPPVKPPRSSISGVSMDSTTGSGFVAGVLTVDAVHQKIEETNASLAAALQAVEEKIKEDGQKDSMAENKSTVSILDDIGSMFDDLADQLDAMLE
ncbi:caskin-1 isoform X3 [Misgurnus anguillicaudatus]|uniref:caskin-1 isoform X3 n=1 Tax=Misgurnus anguillicaudatus TaxID=75329 RepID=UPI003CCF3F86